jgi:hypothetical protein
MLSISKMKINELISPHTVPEIWASKKLVTGPNGIMVAPKRRVHLWYLQTLLHEHLIQHSLKSGGTKDQAGKST